MPHTTRIRLVTADERTIYLSRRKAQDLVDSNLAWWVNPSTARMYFAERKQWRARLSIERDEHGQVIAASQVMQLVNV